MTDLDHRAHEEFLPRPGTSTASLPPTDRAAQEYAVQRLASTGPGEFPETLHQLVSSDFGAVSRLHELVSMAAQWCQDRGARRYGVELDSLAERITEIGEELHLVNEGLAGELAGRSERLAAAVSRSPTRPTRTPSPAASPSASPVRLEAPTPGRRSGR
ncbi:hypothetical protein [Kitasatospora sp. NRRL B-11411]|uniref:hypothetical protein n=1 Tax=Kitasatospora sp. NRRL B-11411 TaxID=1463822 RepID=UPI0004C3BE0A|nr:hypothetical protein [Kitasatospora sp. NRRL B-11411]